MYEIVANPANYGIDSIVKNITNDSVFFEGDNRELWADEVGKFSEKLNTITSKVKKLEGVLRGSDVIEATPASLKTLKIKFFEMDEAINNVVKLTDKIEADFVNK